MGRQYSKQHIKQAAEGFKRWKIRKWDEVVVLAGRDKGKVGIVKEVVHDKVRPLVVIDGVNLQRRPMPKRGPEDKSHVGKFILTEKAMHYSNVGLLDPVTKRPVRVGWAFTENGERVRVTRGKNASGSIVTYGRDRVDQTTSKPVGKLDTPASAAHAVTFKKGEMDEILKQLDRMTLAYYPEGAPAERAFRLASQRGSPPTGGEPGVSGQGGAGRGFASAASDGMGLAEWGGSRAAVWSGGLRSFAPGTAIAVAGWRRPRRP